MKIIIDLRLKEKFPDLMLESTTLKDLVIRDETPELESEKERLFHEVRSTYKIETLKDSPIIRTYRTFYWGISIDPTKIRPAGEALIRRVLKKKPIPKINTFVDAYNLASIKTHMAIAAFDRATLDGIELTLRYAIKGERFRGIGMKEDLTLKGKEPVLTDEEKIIAIYPYRDSDETKITTKTKEALIIACGAPGLTPQKIKETLDTTKRYITTYNS